MKLLCLIGYNPEMHRTVSGLSVCYLKDCSLGNVLIKKLYKVLSAAVATSYLNTLAEESGKLRSLITPHPRVHTHRKLFRGFLP